MWKGGSSYYFFHQRSSEAAYIAAVRKQTFLFGDYDRTLDYPRLWISKCCRPQAEKKYENGNLKIFLKKEVLT